MLPPPADGFLDTTALRAGAPRYPVLGMHIRDAYRGRRLSTGRRPARRLLPGTRGLLAGIFVAVGAFQTAGTRQCPINGLLG
ncbi:MAG TPA: hypothetical protein VEM27_12005, partial [Gemmatimonadales bacterium]|nr:hypothetical protein [Gemmatimonadales bacterium]